VVDKVKFPKKMEIEEMEALKAKIEQVKSNAIALDQKLQVVQTMITELNKKIDVVKHAQIHSELAAKRPEAMVKMEQARTEKRHLREKKRKEAKEAAEEKVKEKREKEEQEEKKVVEELQKSIQKLKAEIGALAEEPPLDVNLPKKPEVPVVPEPDLQEIAKVSKPLIEFLFGKLITEWREEAAAIIPPPPHPKVEPSLPVTTTPSNGSSLMEASDDDEFEELRPVEYSAFIEMTADEMKERMIKALVLRHHGAVVGMVDYAATAIGGEVLDISKATEYRDDPNVVLSFTDALGQCYPMEMTESGAFVKVKLAFPIIPTAFTIEHTSPEGIKPEPSAPKDIELFGFPKASNNSISCGR